MNKTIKSLMICLCFLISNIVFAWSYTGHEIISEIAYNDLSKDQQQKLDIILDTLIDALPSEAKMVFHQQSYSLSKLAKLSILPDYWKRLKFDAIISSLNISDNILQNDLPILLSTANWHYRDTPTNDDKMTKFGQDLVANDDEDNRGKLIFVVSQLASNLKSTEKIQAKALGIIYISHLLGDGHQPLHAVSKDKDQGGNRFCLSRKAKGNRCAYNLHSYWDSAGKWLNNNAKDQILNYLDLIITSYPKDYFKSLVEISNPEIWLSESFKYWPIVYNTKENKFPNQNYETQARIITKERMALAAFRLSNVLQNILE